MGKQKASTAGADLDELKVLTDRMALITRVAKLGVWEWDNKQRIATWDDRMFDIYDIPKTESVSYETWSTAVYPEDLPKVINSMEEAASSKKPYTIEFRIFRPDGSTRHLYGAGGMVFNDQQNVERLTGIIMDITERRQAEEADKRRAEELDALQETVLDITRPHKLDDLLYIIVERAAHLLKAEGGGLYLCDAEKKQARCVVSYKTPKDFTGTILKYGEGIAGRISKTGEALLIDDYSVWPGRAKVFERDRPFRSTVGAPMVWQGKVTGVIDVLRYEGDQPFTENDLELLKLFANHAAIACENTRALEAEILTLARAEDEIKEREKAEKALREGETRFRSLYENSTIGLYRTTPGGRILMANPVLVRMLGYDSFEELAKRNLEEEGYHAEYPREKFRREIEEQGEIKGMESSWIRKDGSSIIIRESARVVRDSHGQTLYYDGVVEDITERKQAEEALQNSERRLQALIENGLDYISLLDAEGNLLWENPSTTIFLGYRFNEFLGKSLFQLIHPDDLEWVGHQFAELLKEPGNRRSGVFRLRRSDNSWRWVNAIASNYLHDPAVGAIVINYRDITERKLAEEELQASEKRFRTMVETFPGMIWVTENDPEYTPIYLSDKIEEIYGYPKEDFFSGRERFVDLIYPEDLDRVNQAVADSVEQKRPYSMELRFRKKDGHTVWIHEIGQGVFDEQGRLEYLIGSALDITGLKQAEVSLRESEVKTKRLLEQQIAINQLALTLGEMLDRDAVYAALYKYVQELTDSSLLGIASYDDHDRTIRMEYIVKDGQELNVQDMPDIPIGKSDKDILNRTIHLGELVNSPNLLEDIDLGQKHYRIDLDGSLHEIITKEDLLKSTARSALYVPMKVKGKVTGVIQLHSTRENAYTAEDVGLLTSLANVAAVSMENARLYEEVSQELEERKRVEKELQTQRDFFYQVMSTMGQGLAVTDAKDRFEFVNPAYAKMTGYTPEELIGKFSWDFSPQGDHAALERETNRRRQGESSTYELHLKHREGYIVPVMLTGVPRFVDGRMQGTIAVITDLTEREYAAEALRRERDRAQQYLDVASVMLVAHDAQGKVMMVNRKACEVLGCQEQEVLGKVWVDTFIPESYQENVSHVFKMLMSGKLEESEFGENPILTRSGEERLITWHNTVIRDAGGRIVGHLGSGEDITERKRAEEKAKREAARVAALARVAARMNAQLELQTVLNIICEETATALHFPAASIKLLNETGDFLHYSAGYGMPSGYGEYCLPIPRSIASEYNLEDKKLSVFPDVQAITGLPNADLYRKFDFRTVITIKLGRDNRIIGMLCANTFGQTREVSEDDKSMLLSLGNLAVQAIVNARLFENVRNQASELARSNELATGLAWVSANMQGTRDPKQLTRILGKELKILGITSFLATLEPEENSLFVQETTISSKILAQAEKLLGIKIRGFRIKRDDLPEIYETLVVQQRPYYSPNILKEAGAMVPAVSKVVLEKAFKLFEGLESHGIYLPLIAGDNVRGVLGLQSPTLLKSDLAAFSVFANNISASMENARLYQEIQSELDERRRTEAALQEAEARYRALVEQIPAIAYTDSAVEMGKTLYINPQLKAIAGYDPEKWITDNELWMKIMHPEDRERVLETYIRTYQAGEPFNVEYRINAPDGHTIWFHDEATLIRSLAGQPMFWQGIMLNITDRKLAEEALRDALAEKEVLLREVHHRVKNNLQAIIYLIEGRLDQVSDPQTVLLMKSLQEQARTMALVYEQLYQSENLAEVRMQRYLQVLAQSIREAFGGDRSIEMNVQSEDISLDIGSAMPCGLMVNELLTNALKYAFPPSFQGIPHLYISLKAQDDHYELVVQDDGVGLPEGSERRTSRGMGLRLVKLWATHQMGGTLEVETGNGTTYRITFPRK